MPNWIVYAYTYSCVVLIFACFCALFSVGNDSAQLVFKWIAGVSLGVLFITILFAIPRAIGGGQ